MPTAGFNYGRETFEFIENLERQSSVDAVMDTAQEALARLGYETLLVCGLPRAEQRLDEMVLAMRFPAEWFKTYVDEGYIDVDPVVRRMKLSRKPFEWRELSYDSERVPRAAEVMQRRADLGFLNAFTVPIHGPPDGMAFVSMNRTKSDPEVRNKPAIHLMALYIFDRVSRLRVAQLKQNTNLTTREREVLTWAAQGKSAWEIGEILNIAKRTVDEHAQNAFRKLGAVNRTQAVAIALRDRLISL
jgi:LuxR family quorum sensing-dependent transcriptional regulator